MSIYWPLSIICLDGRASVRGHRAVDDTRETARRGKRLAGLIIGGGTHGLAGVQRIDSARWARTIGPSLAAVISTLLQADHDAVGEAAAVHDGQPDEAWPIGLEEQRAAAGQWRQRHAVDQDGEQAAAAGDL